MKDGIGFAQRLMGVLERLTEFISVSLLWVLGCIPVVTAGSSCAAAYYTVMKGIRRGRSGIWSCFWYSFRQNLVQGVGHTLLIAVMGGLVVFYWLILDQMAVMTKLYSGLLCVLAILLLALSAWLFPILSRFYWTWTRQVTVAAVLAVAHPARSLGAMALLILCTLGVVLSPLLLAVLPGMYNWCASFLLEPVFRKLTDADAAAGEDPWFLE